MCDFDVIDTLKSQGYGQFPDESTKIKDTHTHSGGVKTYSKPLNSCHKRNIMRGTIIIVDTVMEYFVRGFLIFAFYCPTKSVG